MLKLLYIKKDYLSESDKVRALKNVNLAFRRSEFVSILGPSGCGKTTLLNLIGGLDHYTSGDLVIEGKSTKAFKDHDWDAYRNHSVGFVFQSYNLIPHQSVLANVELALTLTGVSKAERRKKALSALEKVGLKDQIKKRPNQLSGGQMQRVAIARALVNDPEILLADEPTGALDSATSVQILELLKEVSRDKLVIMVTHNPELARDYSTRIIRLLDGEVVDDSNPYNGAEEIKKAPVKKEKKPSMSFFTALSLSLNNLMTKKGRTTLTSFAGSIGIIGIALILALSNGINAYIASVQEETLASTPLTVQAESMDMLALMTNIMGINSANSENAHPLDAVYSSKVMHEMINSFNNAETQTNNLRLFKEFLDTSEEIRNNTTQIQYSYELDSAIFTEDVNGNVIKSDIEEVMNRVFDAAGMGAMSGMHSNNSMSTMFSSITLWEEMLPKADGTGISAMITEQYDLVYGSWPTRYDEVVLIVNERNEISDMALCGLGLKSTEEIGKEMLQSQKGESLNTTVESWSYEDILGMRFKLFLPSQLYQKNPTGGYTLVTDVDKGAEFLYRSDEGLPLRISGIVRPQSPEAAQLMQGALGYTKDLTRHLLSVVGENELILLQKNNPETDVLLNLPFRPADYVEPTEDERVAAFKEYALGLSAEERAKLYRKILAIPGEDFLNATADKTLAEMTRGELEQNIIAMFTENKDEEADISFILEYVKKMSDEELFAQAREGVKSMVAEQYRQQMEQAMAGVPDVMLSSMLEVALMQSPVEISASTSQDRLGVPFSAKEMLTYYEDYVPATHSDSTLEANLKLLGDAYEASPSAIHIYTDTFEKKERLGEIIAEYNAKQVEEDKIDYTDVFAMLMSGMTTVINAIAYVLIAFVSISLVVSSIMIGIITYISVLERTKEIGILRAVGASKRDISRVFSAESIIQGFAAGIIGVCLTLLLTLPINAIIQALTGIPDIAAVLPPAGYLLILVSVLLSYIAGLFPSRVAAKKDPVVALRTE